jgi:hypothetical protein
MKCYGNQAESKKQIKNCMKNTKGAKTHYLVPRFPTLHVLIQKAASLSQLAVFLHEISSWENQTHHTAPHHPKNANDYSGLNLSDTKKALMIKSRFLTSAASRRRLFVSSSSSSSSSL